MLLLILLLLGPSARAALECEAERYANDLLPFAEQGLTITKELAVKNIPEFCRATTRNQAQKDFKEEYGSAIGGSLASDEDIERLSGGEAWLQSYHPDLSIRTLGLSRNPVFAAADLSTLKDLRAYLEAPDDKHFFNGGFDLAELDKPVPAQLDRLHGLGVHGLVQALVCNELVFGFECPRALDRVIETSLPVAEGLNITQPQLYKEILLDDAYDAGLRKAALKLMDRVLKADVKGADFFTDVKSSFVETGIAPEKADEMAWKTMGLLATGGANTANRAMMLRTPKEKFPRKIALAVLGSAAPVLDSLTAGSGRLYSYPKGIHTTCDSGKPYHFWLTAYLAWNLARSGTAGKAAAAAAFLGDKGYQMMSDTATRDPTKPLQESFLSAYSNSIRLDLAYASAGAVYGANAGKGYGTTDLEVDEGIRRTVQESQPVPKLSEAQAKALMKSPLRYGLEWSRLMAPNAAFTLYRKALQ